MQTKQQITLSAWAKINLYLDILSRRENGYHNIVSVMQSVGLFDTVTLTRLPQGSGIRLETNVPGLPCDRRNLAYRAAEKFAAILKAEPDVHITVEKTIPMSAGLAGGSADAAAVIRGLNQLYGMEASREELCRLGATLGADIPFCIVGGAFITEGIGDVLTPCRALSEEQWLVIACGGEGVSTPDAYRALDDLHDYFRTPRKKGAKFAALQSALEAGELGGVRENMYNIFEEVVLPTHTVAGKLIDSLKSSGAQAAMMSGSGPSVFGLFATEQQAKAASECIAHTYGIRAFVTRPVPENTI